MFTATHFLDNIDKKNNLGKIGFTLVSDFTCNRYLANIHCQEPMSRSMQLHYISVTAFS